MNIFSYSACSGRHPVLQGGRKHQARPHLMRKLLSDRSVPRILIAPGGFGKSRLAFEYAQEIYKFYDVYWVDADDPIFLRDLDAGHYSFNKIPSFLERGLVVFDKVPYLNSERRKTFVDVVKKLTEGSCEVIITVRPSFDLAQCFGSRSVCVGAYDLLLTDQELEETKELNFTSHDVRQGLSLQCILERLPCLTWGDKGEFDRFIFELNNDYMPSDMRFVLFAMLLMERGTYEDVELFIRTFKKETKTLLIRHYPILGINNIDESFNAFHVDVDLLLEAFKSKTSELVTASSCQCCEALIKRFVDHLVYVQNYERASELVTFGYSRAKRVSWVESVQEEFHTKGYLHELDCVLNSLTGRSIPLSPKIMLGLAFRQMLFGNQKGVWNTFKVLVNNSRIHVIYGAVGALMCLTNTDTSVREKAQKVLAEAKNLSSEESFGKEVLTRSIEEQGSVESAKEAQYRFVIAISYLLSQQKFDDYERIVRNSLSGFACYEICLLTLLIACEINPHERFFALVEDVLDVRSDRNMDCTLIETLLFKRVSENLPQTHLSESYSSERYQEMLEIYTRFTREFGEVDKKMQNLTQDNRNACAQGNSLLVAPSHFEGGNQRGRSHAVNETGVIIPHLHIRLFGGMEVTIGGEIIDPKLFTKQKAKTLLAILALNLGKEFPRQRILDSMWPNLVGDAPMNNYYSMWSSLRKTLSTADGKCPYLVRQQASCMLDSRYVTCDVTEIDALLHTMLFDDLDMDEWVDASARLEAAYTGELLPSEVKNEYIVRQREAYHQNLIDALVNASNHTSELGNTKLGLWFARVALSYDESREDVYRVLMQAQALSGQRSEAIDTYMTCMKHMREEYGVDLSPETMKLYEGLVLNREQDHVAQEDEQVD